MKLVFIRLGQFSRNKYKSFCLEIICSDSRWDNTNESYFSCVHWAVAVCLVLSTLKPYPSSRLHSVNALFFFFLNGCTCAWWKFSGQGLNLSHSFYNAGSFNPLLQTRDWTCTSAATWVTALGLFTHCATVEIPECT